MTLRTAPLRFRVVWVLVALLAATMGCSGRDLNAEAEALQVEIAALTTERDGLRTRLSSAVADDGRLTTMPDAPLTVGVPTVLVEHLVTTLITGLTEQTTLELGGLRIARSGSIRRIVPLGDYDLLVRLDRITARLKAGAPTLTFGRNQIGVRLPVRVVSGSGAATIDFPWAGRSLGGAVCGDMEVRETVTGTVVPATYNLTGSLQLAGADHTLIVRPRVPAQRIRVRVTPSKASWEKVRAILESKGGVCGFVLDRVNIEGALQELLSQGFNVRLPTDRLQPIALPVGLTQTIDVDGAPLTLQVTATPPTITADMIWLGATIDVAVPTPR